MWPAMWSFSHVLIIFSAETVRVKIIPYDAVADPGFPVGGRGPRGGGGTWTPEAVTFRKFCMSK